MLGGSVYRGGGGAAEVWQDVSFLSFCSLELDSFGFLT